jgi:hypothetical protein
MPDFSNYSGDLIRAGTIAAVVMRVIFGDGVDGVLTPTKNGDAQLLKAEFTILEGEFAKRKLFASWLVMGSTDGQKSMAERYLAMLKRIIASAKYLDPNDKSPETIAKYKMEYRDFDGLRFLAEIGVEAGKDGFEAKNVITRVITRDSPQWGGRPPFDQNPPDSISGGPTGGRPSGGASGGGAPPAAPIGKPSWAG